MALQITNPKIEFIDNLGYLKEIDAYSITMEHSLLSVSKWETKYGKPFLYGEKTFSEMNFYFKCMTLNQNLPEIYYEHLTRINRQIIQEYINASFTATKRKESKNSEKNNDVITSEYLYYCMFANQIPKECEKWHLSRLLALLGIFSQKNEEADPKNKKNKSQINQQEINARNKAKSDAMKARLHVKG